MGGVTIKLFDPLEQKRYEASVEEYEAKVEKIRDTGYSPDKEWPKYPDRPKDFADSCDQGLPYAKQGGSGPAMVGGIGGYGEGPVGSDPRPRDPVILDGSSASEIEGYESRWDGDANPNETPFKVEE